MLHLLRHIITKYGKALLILGTTTLASTPAVAQLATGPGRVRVQVVLMDSLSTDESPAVVIRQNDAGAEDRIVLDARRANGRVLAASVYQLLVAREIGGGLGPQGFRLRVAPDKFPRQWIHTERLRAAHVVNRLKEAHPRQVAGLGLVRVTTLMLPADALRGRVHGSFRTGQ
jgi:hypothetical protein